PRRAVLPRRPGPRRGAGPPVRPADPPAPAGGRGRPPGRHRGRPVRAVRRGRPRRLLRRALGPPRDGGGSRRTPAGRGTDGGERAGERTGADGLAELGKGIGALESVPTALACFASAPEDYTTAIGRAVLLGGDTDTIAAMTGALSGAYLGLSAIPAGLLERLE